MVANYEITGEWFGRIEDVIEYINENGCEVEYYDCENISFFDEDDNEYLAKLGGTETTIYIESIKEV